ncbi:MAG: hypothetical protein COA75_12650 [Cellvibrionales bacterium]|nr:MAG: hypothetical protein COA75_12650 [Cellvibrionales bacterium]
MLQKLSILILFTTLSTFSFANDKNEKVRVLMEAQGLLSMFEQQLAMGEIQSEKMGKQVIDQIMAQLNPNQEFQNRFTAAFQTFMKKVANPYTAEQIVEVWSKYYGGEFASSELDKLIDFYTSDIGKKEVSASKVAITKFTEHFQTLNEPLMKSAMNEYISELKIAAKECNCAKK